VLALFSDPVALYHQAPTRARADTVFDERIRQGVETADANDLLYQYEASGDYSPSPLLDQVRTRVVAVNTADDPTNPPWLGIMEREIARVPRGRYILIPRSDDTTGHASYLVGKLYKPYIADLLAAP
jgi:homoserine O-acetyltransferase/O-succinyltransferase